MRCDYFHRHQPKDKKGKEIGGNYRSAFGYGDAAFAGDAEGDGGG
jgi:hypothetical protein